MNTIYNKILSIGMSFIVLFSTASFSVDLHYCRDKLIDIGIFEQAETCCVKSQKSGTDNCKDLSESCCHKDKLFKIGHNDLKKSFNNNFSSNPINFVETHFSYINAFLELKERTSSINDYRPPLLIRNITILHESLLI
ncbi:HYC_CC_PP family protein [Mariniflexile sp. HMF6888]|uniref:HYC_CC_PP family protein n=1 Tax=Mariniflexile sp. HMF6888 TaxID=3373086 RepID=UPI0037AB94CF